MGERVAADFVPLNNRSHYSFLQREAAILSPSQLVEGLSHHYAHATIADRSLLAEGRLFQTAEKYGLNPIPSLRVSLQPAFGDLQEALLLPRNNEGLRRLHRLHTQHNLEEAPLTPLDIHGEGNVFVILTGPLNASATPHLFESHVFRGITSPFDQVATNSKLSEVLRSSHKVVAVPEVRMGVPDDAWKLAWLSKVTGERLDPTVARYYIPRPEEILRDYDHLNHAVGITHDIASSIHIDKPLPPDIRPRSVPSGWTTEAYLKHLGRKLVDAPEYEHLRDRVEQEIQAMTDARREGFASAIFIVQEIIGFCRENKVPIKTTGSANNSVLLSLLGITQLTPDEANSCDFDRFLNEQRLGRPDIDMEVGYRDREQVIAYLRHLYGELASEIIVPHTMDKATLLRVARESHAPIDGEEITELARAEIPFKLQPHGSKIVLLDTAPFIRVGGSNGKGRLVAEIDRVDAETGFDYVALDFLGRQGPQRLHLAEDFAKKRRIAIPKDENDPYVMQRIFSGDTIGITDVESPHMQNILTRLRRIYRQKNRNLVAEAISISKPEREIRERYFAQKATGEGALPADIVRRIGLSGPIIFQQEDLVKVARAAGFSVDRQEQVRKMLSDRNISFDEKYQTIQRISQGLSEQGYAAKVRRELEEQMKSYVGYVLVKGHALSLAHGAEDLARHAVYDPVGFHAAVMTTVADYWDRSDYTFQGYVNDALRHGVTFVYPNTMQRVPESPQIWSNTIALSNSLLQAARQGKREIFFEDEYDLWIKAYKDWKKGYTTTQRTAELEWDIFGSCFATNPIDRFDSDKRINLKRDRQRAIVQPVAFRKIMTANGPIFLVTVDSGSVHRAIMRDVVGSEDDLRHPFLEVVVGNTGSQLEIKEIINPLP